jgi:Uncharacterized conserved protein (DUF2183)
VSAPVPETESLSCPTYGAALPVAVGVAELDCAHCHGRVAVPPALRARLASHATHVGAKRADEARASRQGEVVASAPVLVPPPGARFAVVSDVDDTVVRSDAYRLVRHARAMLLEQPARREAFPGAAALYRALEAGPSGRPQNPVFYASSSPTNVYDLFEEILEVHGFPRGPIFLKDFGVNEETLFKAEHGAHKRKIIGRLFETYPGLPFVLVGDSGQEDATIYRGLARDYPGRVAAVFIRGVREKRREAVEAVAAEARAAGVGMWLVRDSAEMAEHARRAGLVSDDGAARVRREVERARGGRGRRLPSGAGGTPPHRRRRAALEPGACAALGGEKERRELAPVRDAEAPIQAHDVVVHGRRGDAERVGHFFLALALEQERERLLLPAGQPFEPREGRPPADRAPDLFVGQLDERSLARRERLLAPGPCDLNAHDATEGVEKAHRQHVVA